MMRRYCYCFLFIAFVLSLSFTQSIFASVSVVDDAQRKVSLAQPAKRIISLAPHTTELVFAAGAGHLLVGVSEYSDYPEEAKKIASIGSIFALDIERLIALKPDLIIMWGTGNAKLLAKKLRDHRLVVYESEAYSFETIASSIERLAILSGTQEKGNLAASQFRQKLHSLQQQYALKDQQKPLSVFFQIGPKPLMTINKKHMISNIISLCGGHNVFHDLNELSTTITMEAVIAANPDAIVTSEGASKAAFEQWKKIPQLTAVKNNNLLTVNGNHIYRSSPRILEGIEDLCKKMAQAKR